MKATTHTEVYRPFEGELKAHPRRPLVLARSGVRIAFKRRLPIILLFAPLAIACIVASFRVHLYFNAPEMFGIETDPRGAIVGSALAQALGDVVTNIFVYVRNTALFVLIVMAWFGSGLIAEDKRMGANQLYFSRPLSRLEYLSGKFLAACTFGALGLIVPTLVICSVASFASPEWSFVTEQGDTILWALLFGLLWVATLALLILTVSSVTSRRTHAMVGSVGLLFGTMFGSRVLVRVLDDNRLTILDLFKNMERIGEWMFGVTLIQGRSVSAESSLAAIGVLWLVCLFILTERVRKLEVVA